MKIVDIWNVKLGEKQISIEGAADPTFLNFEQDLITVHKNEFKFWSISESSVIEESIVASEMPIAKVWVLPGVRNIFYTDGESIDVLDSRSHQLIARINLENVPISSIENMAFSPEKGVLAISGTHNEKGSIVIGFWDLRSLRLIHVSERELGFVEHGIQFSKDETKFYLSYKNPNDQTNLIEVWEIREQADSNPVAFTVLEAALLE